jgi:hypothetical protein
MTKNDVTDMARDAGIDDWWNKEVVDRQDLQKHLETLIKMATEKEKARCCAIVYGMAGSDNVAQRTVDAIKKND